MAYVFPFKGFRYNKDIVRDLNRVVTQPYDKTTPSMQDAYYQRSPYNVVRITLNVEKRENPETGYPDAGATFRKWIEQNILIQDSAPAFYAYYQQYVINGATKRQKGFISLLDLERSEAGIIPHEQTLAAPKQDRLRLMRSVEANEDLIYMLYSDESLIINSAMDAAISGRMPEIEITDEYGAIHRLWAIIDPDVILRMQNAMRSRNLLIADGHHRFETSVNFMKECQQQDWQAVAAESFNRRMVACFNLTAGVTILPTHRLVRDLPSFNTSSFLRSIDEHFAVEAVPSASELWAKMERHQDDCVYGFYAANAKHFYLLRMHQTARERMGAGQLLDVGILHSLLLNRWLGIDETKLEAQAHLDYARERESCISFVDEGRYQAAFFLNPPTSGQMQRIASIGQRMPQKSTDFYPKLLTGLIFMKMEIGKS